MALAAPRQPALLVTNQGGGNPVSEGPYLLAVSPSNAPSTLGVTLNTIDAWEEEEVIGPWKNFQWSQISYSLGYRLHANLHFVAVESDLANSTYGLTLLHRLWRIGIEYQITYAPLQFRMFTLSPWRPVVIGGTEWRPQLAEGKQGLYTVDFPIVSRDLVSAPGEWAQQGW